MSGSHAFSLRLPPPECNFQSETKIEPDLRLDKESLRQQEFVFIHIRKAMTIMFSWRRSAFSFRYVLNFLNCTSLRTADVFLVVASLTPKNKLETRAEKNGCSRRLFITGKKKKMENTVFCCLFQVFRSGCIDSNVGRKDIKFCLRLLPFFACKCVA